MSKSLIQGDSNTISCQAQRDLFLFCKGLVPDCKASGGQLGNVPTHPRPRALQAPLSAGISPPRPRSGAEAGDNSRQPRGGDSMGLRSRMPFPVPVCPQSAVCSWLSHLPSLVYFLQLHNQHVTVYSLSSSTWPPYPPTTLSLFSTPPTTTTGTPVSESLTGLRARPPRSCHQPLSGLPLHWQHRPQPHRLRDDHLQGCLALAHGRLWPCGSCPQCLTGQGRDSRSSPGRPAKTYSRERVGGTSSC